jgi:hypothetical protein
MKRVVNDPTHEQSKAKSFPEKLGGLAIYFVGNSYTYPMNEITERNIREN